MGVYNSYEFMSDDEIQYRYDGVRKIIEKQEQEQESKITNKEKLSEVGTSSNNKKSKKSKNI